MENKSLLPAIVALLIVASIVSLSTTSVSATTSSTIDKTLVKANTPIKFTVTVTNSGTTPIDNVRIIVDNGSGFTPLSTLPKDNIVKCAVDNVVVLPAGTVVQLLANENIVLPENTEVTLLENKQVWVPRLSHNTQMNENILVAPSQDTTAENISSGDNIMVTQGVSVNLNNDNRLRLLKDTSVVVVSGNIVKLPENTLFGLVAQNDNGIVVGENVDVVNDVTVTLKDNRVKLVTPNPGSSPADNLPAGENLQLIDNKVVVTAGTTVQLGKTVAVRIAENENVLRVKDSQLDAIGATVLTQPENWTQTSGITDDVLGLSAVEWFGIGDNIPAGGSRLFPFYLTTPSTTIDNAIIRYWIRTSTIEGPYTIMVDGKSPTATVTASPSLVKENTAVTLKVVASEKISMPENTVLVAENNAPDNTPVSMTSSDNITWTGTYMTVDNWLRDGTANVYVIGAQIEDLVGNLGVDNQTTFTVDREKPPTPKLTDISGLPSEITNIGTGTISGIALDNFLNTIQTMTNGTVEIRIGTSTNDATLLSNGHFYYNYTLTQQGTQEVGIRYIDQAGNIGKENAENVTYDSVAPVITPGTISGKTLADGVRINDNTPTVKLSIMDATLGIENAPFDNTDNSGYSVQLWDENDDLIATLINATPPAENMPNTISFENTYPTALALSDGTYSIYAVAGDNLQMDNLVISFVIDTTPPAAPNLTATASPNALAPDIKRTTGLSLGGQGEPGATIRIWTSPDPFTSETNVENVVVGADGTWTATLTIDQGVTVRIRISQVDIAGNESTSKVLYGYLKVDASAPVVTITAPATGTKTDKASITVSGTVTKDAWESWTDITLRLQNGVTSTSIIIPVSNNAFSVNVTLAEGKNSIIATATDSVGNYTSSQVTVERTVTSWAIYAIILVIIALILAAIAIFRMR